MRLVDARRLTGPNHITRGPLVVVELEVAPEERQAAERLYRAELARALAAAGLPEPTGWAAREHRGGVVLGYEAPVDVMLACTEASEWAALSAVELAAGRPPLDLAPRLAIVRDVLARDRSPKMIALQAEAARRGIPFLWDDERVILGMGIRSRVALRSDLPEVDEVPWERLGRIPVVMITGTNGKTTSTRLVARMGREAGKVVGATSSDRVTIGEAVIEEGDWTGPAAARVVLGDATVELAVLETARGGILRRGLAVDACDVALITNVSDDHVGGYGIDDLAAMTEVKAVVARAVPKAGVVVLSAHDPKLVALAPSLAGRVVLFADLERGDDAAREAALAHARGGGEVVTAEGGAFVAGGAALARVDEAPITFDGAARYNVDNILGAIAVARALGLPPDAIRRAITGFGAADNPRRGELVERDGVRILLDFGHNPDGVRALMKLVDALRARRPGRLTVIVGSAGDRTDRDIDEVVRVVCEHRPDRVIARELPDYLRGRVEGEVPAVFREAFARHGLEAGAFAVAASEVAALELALVDAGHDDLVVMLVHLDAEAVRDFLRDAGDVATLQ